MKEIENRSRPLLGIYEDELFHNRLIIKINCLLRGNFTKFFTVTDNSAEPIPNFVSFWINVINARDKYDVENRSAINIYD